MVERISTVSLASIASTLSREAAPTPVRPQVDFTRQRRERDDEQRRRQSPNSNPEISDGGATSGDHDPSQIEEPAQLPQEPGVTIDSNTAMLLGDNLGEVIARAIANIQRIAERLMRADTAASEGLGDRFREIVPERLPQAIKDQVSRGQVSPHGLSFEDVRVWIDREDGNATLEIGQVRFVDRVDFRATGVVFDAHGYSAIHGAPEPGMYVDTGDHGEAVAHQLIERVRRELPEFGDATDTQGVIVVIRAELSEFSGFAAEGRIIDFDLLVPFKDPEQPDLAEPMPCGPVSINLET